MSTRVQVLLAIALAAVGMVGAHPACAADDTERYRVEGPWVRVALERYLDRLIAAESGGNPRARNPRSTAVGHFQFIEATFLGVVARHFAGEVAGLAAPEVLALRIDPAFSRRAAEAFTRDNADYLVGRGVAATFTNLRLAHLLGPAAAVRVLTAPLASNVGLWVGPAAVRANPFMAGMRVETLIARAAREASSDGRLAGRPRQPDAVVAVAPKPAIAVACDLGLASCRKWLALAERRATRGRQVASKP